MMWRWASVAPVVTLEMNVYKPLIIFNVTHSIAIMTDGCTNFRKFLVEGTKPNLKKINEYVERSLMLVTALSPVIGYDKASKIAHYAMDNDLTLKAAALKLGFVTEAEFDRVVDPKKMVKTLCGDRCCLGRGFSLNIDTSESGAGLSRPRPAPLCGCGTLLNQELEATFENMDCEERR